MEITITAVGAVILILGLWALIWVGWRNRLGRQHDIDEPSRSVENMGEPLTDQTVAGEYVVTTRGGDWLDRIAVHELGVKSKATISFYSQGLVINREGASQISIPSTALRGAKLTSGMVGKFVEKDGLVVIEWNLGETPVDTGFRPKAGHEKRIVLDAVTTLVRQAQNSAHSADDSEEQ